MAIAHVKIGVNPHNYAGIAALSSTVIAGLTAHPGNFPTPLPSIAILTADLLALNNAITAWGVVGNRGSHSEWVALVLAALTMRNDLLLEADYVNSLVVQTDPYATQAAFIATSGFSVKNLPMPQGVLAAPQDLHRIMSNGISEDEVMLGWKKPIGLHSPNNVKFYQVFILGLASFYPTKTKYLLDSPTLSSLGIIHGSVFNVSVFAWNDKGEGLESAVLTVNF